MVDLTAVNRTSFDAQGQFFVQEMFMVFDNYRLHKMTDCQRLSKIEQLLKFTFQDFKRDAS